MPKKDGTPTKWEQRDLFFIEWENALYAKLGAALGEGAAAQIRETRRIDPIHVWEYDRIQKENCREWARIFIERGLPKPPTWWRCWDEVAAQAAADGLKVRA